MEVLGLPVHHILQDYICGDQNLEPGTVVEDDRRWRFRRNDTRKKTFQYNFSDFLPPCYQVFCAWLPWTFRGRISCAARESTTCTCPRGTAPRQTSHLAAATGTPRAARRQRKPLLVRVCRCTRSEKDATNEMKACWVCDTPLSRALCW